MDRVRDRTWYVDGSRFCGGGTSKKVDRNCAPPMAWKSAARRV